jgi:hypothetical protein
LTSWLSLFSTTAEGSLWFGLIGITAIVYRLRRLLFSCPASEKTGVIAIGVHNRQGPPNFHTLLRLSSPATDPNLPRLTSLAASILRAWRSRCFLAGLLLFTPLDPGPPHPSRNDSFKSNFAGKVCSEAFFGVNPEMRFGASKKWQRSQRKSLRSRELLENSPDRIFPPFFSIIIRS